MISSFIPALKSVHLWQDQDSIPEERLFIKLAELCARTCRVLEATDDLSCIGETIESLGRCVGSAHPFSPVIMSGTRTVRRIEFGIRERGDRARDLREDDSDYTEKCVIAWRAELCEKLGVLGVRLC